MKTVIIGGHLTPALSVIEELPEDAEILYIGRKFSLEGDQALSLEYSTITKKGIQFYDLKTGRLQRAITRRTIPSLTKIPVGFAQSLFVLRKFKPDVVVGFGGYVSFPVVLAANLLKIPVVIHEQTTEAGAANKYLSKYASKICISFETSRKYFPKEKVVLTGNPVRKSIREPSKSFKISQEKPIIYITGGSQGSHFINTLVEGSLRKLVEKFVIVHQTGGASEFNDFDKLTILKEGLNKDRESYVHSKFFSADEIGGILKAASLVVTRAGINSVSEIIVLKKPAFLIPLPVSQRDEQIKNASLVKKIGLGEVSEQKDLNPENFTAKINEMMERIETYKLNESKNRFPKNAAKKIVEVIYEVHKDSN